MEVLMLETIKMPMIVNRKLIMLVMPLPVRNISGPIHSLPPVMMRRPIAFLAFDYKHVRTG